MRALITVLLVIALLFAVSKWIIWRLSFMAVLLYYGERGQELPDPDVIQKYQTEAGTEVIETEKLTKMKLSLNELKYNISCYLRERIKRFGTDFLSNDFYAVPYFIFANISEKFMSPWSDIRK